MCFLPADLSINIGPFHFYAVRIVGLLALLRVYSDSKRSYLTFNTIDKLFISYNVLGSLIYFIASQNKGGALIYLSGTLVDSIVIYIVLRHSIQSKNNIHIATKTFCYCVLALLPFIALEYFTAKNFLSFLGRDSISIRNGEIRAAGTFSNAILFGAFAAAIVPILWSGYKQKKNGALLLSVVSCLFFVYSSSSSGPIAALVASISLIIFFKWKQYSSQLTWSLFLATLFIHLARETPIWHFLYIRISIKASSTGLHRYLLTDAAVKEFWNWWLLGYGDAGPKWHITYWPWTYALSTDVTNHYLLVGVRGGFFTMLLFIILCFKTIKILGSYAISQPNKKDQWLWWGFTVMMITHCITFLSVAYFGQITMLLYLTIAIAAYALNESREQMQAQTESNRRF